jgi:hypothetical protein
LEIIMKYIFITLLILLVAFSSPLFADSFYSSIGLGTPHYFVSPKAAGMGGAGLSVVDPFAVNALNPAALNIGRMTTVSVDMKYEMIENKLGANAINTSQGNAAGFHFVVPLKSYLKLISGLRPLTDSRYTLDEENETTYADFTRVVRGSGGLNVASLGLQYIINNWIAIGALANFNFGSFNEDWKTEFFEPGYETVSDNLNSYMWGSGFQIGLLLRPSDKIGLGITYQSGSDLVTETQTEVGITVKSTDERINIRYPQSLGFGASYLANKLLFAADFYHHFWSDYAIENIKIDGYKDYTRLGGGIEYQDARDPFARYMRRIALRIGAYMANMPNVDIDGNRVKERFITAGLGFPFLANRGRVDLSIEYGQRDSGLSDGYGEQIIRFSGSVTGGELWFQRRNR